MKETIKLTFEYSKELEVKRIAYTINRLGWYINNNYQLDWMSFPKSFDVNNLTNISEADISRVVDKEYDSQKYILAIEPLNQLFNLFEIRLKKFIGSLNLPIIQSIIVNLTFYGMGGSYHLPNRVVCNI